MNAYEAKQEARQAQLLRRADKLEAASRAALEGADKMAEIIPFGQPILVGHYSEGRDRRYRERIRRRFELGSEFAALAKRCRERAANIGGRGISSDDPDAPDKLREKLAGLEALQSRMVAANKLVRKKDRVGLAAMGFSGLQIESLFTPDFAGRIGFENFRLTNNNSNIRRIRERVAELERHARREDREEVGGGYTYREDTAENRAMFLFPGKPNQQIITALKSNGFKWSPTRSAWVRQLNENAVYAARQVRRSLDYEGQSNEKTPHEILGREEGDS